MSILTLDFETHAIENALPPKPVGVSIKVDNEPSVYLHWGHPDGGNISEENSRQIVASYFQTHEVLCHNAAFDLAVAKYWWGLDYPAKLHDTMFLLFMENPHSENLSLKPNADRLLGTPPVEQDELHNWILANVKKATKKTAGAYIAYAPATLVAPYACGDTDRTKAIFDLLYPQVPQEPYQLECQLLPILTESTLSGIRVDTTALAEDLAYYKDYVLPYELDDKIYEYLHSSPFNIDSGDELADAIDSSGLPVEWVRTETGARSTSKDNLPKAIKDSWLLNLLRYRGILSTCLDTFMEPWATSAVNGRMHFSWNQVRNREAKDSAGTRTGRLSSSPSFLNIPTHHLKLMVGEQPLHDVLGLPPLPNVKRYLLPEDGHQWLERDYASQEMRVLGHYEDGALLRQFLENPRLDLHQWMSDTLTEILGFPISRKDAKTIVFAILYGAGIDRLAFSLKCSYEQAQTIKKTYMSALPGIRNVQNDIKRKWGSGLPFKTFGGRYYHKEPSKMVKGRMVDFGYKGLNYLIQGSSADITKQAIINYNSIRKDGRFLLTVHDSINVSGDREDMALLEQAMLDVPLDVPLLSDGKWGANYGTLKEYV